jgi:hypothetical protein
MIFGCSRGEFKFPDRDLVNSSYWQQIFEDADLDYHGCPNKKSNFDGFDNDTFTIRPYYWGDCDCGFEELYAQWWDGKKHSDECYQNWVDKEKILSGWIADDYGYLHLPNSSWQTENQFEETIYKNACKKFGFNYDDGGYGVHCTCGLNNSYDIWLETHNHTNTCSLVLPNFTHKRSGFSIKWYKYPFRDSYMNMDLSKKDIVKIFKECAQSIT